MKDTSQSKNSMCVDVYSLDKNIQYLTGCIFKKKKKHLTCGVKLSVNANRCADTTDGC